MIPNPQERFTGRVESYRRYRPGYPAEAVEWLRRECGLGDNAEVADIAAGTGLLTEKLLAAGFAVTAVEPNAEMRAACGSLQREYPQLRIVEGSAEATSLPGASADLITVAQAMHWFHLERTKREFARILRPGGGCAVIYNNRKLGGDPFHDGYEHLLRHYGADYAAVKQQHMGRGRLAEFFAPAEMKTATFPNAQRLTLEGLEGRVFSSSYMPKPDQPRYKEVKEAIASLFAETQRDGAVIIEYECVVCWGKIRR